MARQVSRKPRPTLPKAKPAVVAPSTLPPLALWGLFALLILLQYWSFRTFATREVTWAFPTYTDQLRYLIDTYTAHHAMETAGFWRGAWSSLTTLQPTGMLMPFQGSLLLKALGLSRLSVLMLNFFYLVGFEAVLLTVLWWATRNLPATLIGVSLFVCTLGRFLPMAGLSDFRMDPGASFLYGILLCLVIRSRFFLHRRWAIAAGVVSAWLVCYRFLTLAYLVPQFALCLAGLGLMVLISRHRLRRACAMGRLQGLLLTGVVIIGLAGPVLAHQWPAIRIYYFDAHVSGSQKQARETAETPRLLSSMLGVYPVQLWETQWGRTAQYGSALIVITAIVLAVGMRQQGRIRLTREAALLAGLSVLVPLLVLSYDPIKSSAVAGIFVPGCVWLLMAPFIALSRRVPPQWSRVLTGAALLMAALAIWQEWSGSRLTHFLTAARDTVLNANQLADAIARECRTRGWQQPGIAVNSLVDELSPAAIMVHAYEQTGQLLTPMPVFQGLLTSLPWEETVRKLDAADIVILSDHGGPQRIPNYPFQIAMRQYYPAMLEHANTRMRRIGQYRIFGSLVTVFARSTGA